jgi:general secretion pathway protein G
MFTLQNRRRRRAFTLMEVLLVLAILVILGSMVGFFIAGMQRGAYEDLARTQIGMFANQLDVYRLHVGSYPNANQGLQALRLPPADLTLIRTSGEVLIRRRTSPWIPGAILINTN